MTKFDEVNLTGLVIFDPATDNGTRVGFSEASTIILDGQEAVTFWNWVSKSWKDVFSNDLQSLVTHDTFGDLLTSIVRLATFIEDLCTPALADENAEISSMARGLKTAMQGWPAANVDTVFISGIDLRGQPNM